MQLEPQEFQLISLAFVLYLGWLLEGLQQLQFPLTSLGTVYAQ